MMISSVLWLGLALFFACLLCLMYMRVRENSLKRQRVCEACEMLHSLDEEFSVNGRRVDEVVMPLTPVKSLYELTLVLYHHMYESGPYSLLLGMQLGVLCVGYGVRDSFE